MTVAWRHLVGTRENSDVTILAHLLDNWNSVATESTTPLIEAFTYTPEKTLESQNTLNPNRILLHIPARERDENNNDEPLGDCSHRWTTHIQIDIWSAEEALLGLFEDEVNRILWEISPNSGLRLKKSDGANPPTVGANDSEAELFMSSEVQFESVDDDDEWPDRVGSQGVLKIESWKDKS